MSRSSNNQNAPLTRADLTNILEDFRGHILSDLRSEVRRLVREENAKSSNNMGNNAGALAKLSVSPNDKQLVATIADDAAQKTLSILNQTVFPDINRKLSYLMFNNVDGEEILGKYREGLADVMGKGRNSNTTTQQRITSGSTAAGRQDVQRGTFYFDDNEE